LFALLCVTGTAWAGQAQLAGSSSVFAQNVPDDASSTVGPGYTGLDPAAIVRELEATGITKPKSEYETSADYQRRISTLPSQSGSYGLSLDGELAFVLNGPTVNVAVPSGGVKFNYDANKRLMDVEIQIDKTDFGLDWLPALSLRSAILRSDRYMGENTYGATAEVTSILSREFGVTIENGTWLTPARAGSLSLEQTGVTLPLPMPPAVAKDFADHLRVLLICRLTSPWLRETSFVGSGATIQSPYEGVTIYKYLHISPEALWVFDDRDGKVIAKFTSSSLAAEWNRIAEESERERRKVYPLTLEIRLADGFSYADFTYQFDDKPEQSGEDISYVPGSYVRQVHLPLIIEAKNYIAVKLDSKLSYEAYIKESDLIFTLNGVQVKPKWHTGKNPVTHRYEAAATFKLP
jgi:hypothetical protein